MRSLSEILLLKLICSPHCLGSGSSACKFLVAWLLKTILKQNWSTMDNIRATSHTRLKAHAHCNVRALIGQKGRDHPSSFHIRRWRSKGPKKSLWMKNLHGVLHGKLWMRVHDMSKFVLGPPPRGRPDANSERPWQWNNYQWLLWLFYYLFQHWLFRTYLLRRGKGSFLPIAHKLKCLKLVLCVIAVDNFLLNSFYNFFLSMASSSQDGSGSETQ